MNFGLKRLGEEGGEELKAFFQDPEIIHLQGNCRLDNLCPLSIDYVFDGEGQVLSAVTHIDRQICWCLTRPDHQTRGLAMKLLGRVVPKMQIDHGAVYVDATTLAGVKLCAKAKAKFPYINVTDPNNLGNGVI